ncbi:hypothetical protein GM921_09650 [Pedobacter sp. LMG 31464]|uniref:Uncharacterized protein n=1 Tax=Pedobacter planticolens TaxID=2679964 RepID=A0A923DZ18_9SPHI|nr:hypothetical protein [Pedobacter planticolens]MBB2145750.1 hypothetical protein [Pedobacter planticolens]
MKKTTMEDFRLMDRIMLDLHQKRKSVMDFEAELPLRHDDIDYCLDELENMGLAEKIFEDGGGTYQLTVDGKRFIKNGTFEQKAQREEVKVVESRNLAQQESERKEIEFNWKAKDEKRKNTTLLFSFVLLCFGAWNIYLQTANSNRFQQTNDEVDSIKTLAEQSKKRIDLLTEQLETANRSRTSPEKHR